jgi:hypothetical protein
MSWSSWTCAIIRVCAETRVEQAIIDNLQAFLLELGKGFSFVARQKRMRFEEEDLSVGMGRSGVLQLHPEVLRAD